MCYIPRHSLSVTRFWLSSSFRPSFGRTAITKPAWFHTPTTWPHGHSHLHQSFNQHANSVSFSTRPLGGGPDWTKRQNFTFWRKTSTELTGRLQLDEHCEKTNQFDVNLPSPQICWPIHSDRAVLHRATKQAFAGSRTPWASIGTSTSSMLPIKFDKTKSWSPLRFRFNHLDFLPTIITHCLTGRYLLCLHWKPTFCVRQFHSTRLLLSRPQNRSLEDPLDVHNHFPCAAWIRFLLDKHSDNLRNHFQPSSSTGIQKKALDEE